MAFREKSSRSALLEFAGRTLQRDLRGFRIGQEMLKDQVNVVHITAFMVDETGVPSDLANCSILDSARPRCLCYCISLRFDASSDSRLVTSIRTSGTILPISRI